MTTRRPYLFVGGPMHGQQVICEPIPYKYAKPLKARYLDPETELPTDSFEEITYFPDKMASLDEDGTRWVLHVMLEDRLVRLGPFAKTRLAFGAAMRRLPGVEVDTEARWAR